MIAKDHREKQRQILMKKISFNAGINNFPAFLRKRRVQLLFQIKIDCLAVGGRSVILDLRIETLSTISYGSSQYENPNRVGRLDESQVAFAPKALCFVLDAWN